jgi:hypothetical protein
LTRLELEERIDPLDHGIQRASRKGPYLVKETVYPELDGELVLYRLDMDVRCSFFCRQVQKIVQQFLRRCCRGNRCGGNFLALSIDERLVALVLECLIDISLRDPPSLNEDLAQ